MANKKPKQEKAKPDVSAIIAIAVAIIGFLAILFGVLYGGGAFGKNTPAGNPGDNTDKITVTFEVNGGMGTYNDMTFVLDENNSYTFTDEEQAAIKEALQKDGYGLKGLSTTPDGEGGWTITIPEDAESPVTLYAIWEENKYTITFNMHGHGTAPEDITDATALPAELPTVANDGDWFFVGWYLDGEYETEATAGATISEDTTLHARWQQVDDPEPEPEPDDYTITFDMHGHGTAPENITYALTLPATLPTVEDVAGWHFEGWYLDEDFNKPAEAGAPIGADTTLHALWNRAVVPMPGQDRFDVGFNMHGHGTQIAEITDVTALPDSLPEVADVDGWHFEGWYLDASFKTRAEAGEFIYADTTLHAKWVAV